MNGLRALGRKASLFDDFSEVKMVFSITKQKQNERRELEEDEQFKEAATYRHVSTVNRQFFLRKFETTRCEGALMTFEKRFLTNETVMKLFAIITGKSWCYENMDNTRTTMVTDACECGKNQFRPKISHLWRAPNFRGDISGAEKCILKGMSSTCYLVINQSM